jgi:hypothetical protein
MYTSQRLTGGGMPFFSIYLFARFEGFGANILREGDASNMKTKLHIYHKILLKFSNPNHVFE